VPKQPLYGKREDALIADTFVKYLDTKDPTLPLLFPMVKSVVRGMDAVQAFAKQEWKTDVTGFVVCGASKRGWTTWLTAATGDKRVKAIAPLVFDSLNLLEQMPNQVKSFGRYSEMIKDYEQHKLLPLPETAEARQLWAMVDPYAYLDKLTMPKMIVNGTNDRYWAQDALNFYWNDLKGPKNVCYVPNAGHDLRPMKDPGEEKPAKDLFPMRAVDTLAAFSRGVIGGQNFPLIGAEGPKVGDWKGKYVVTFSVIPKNYRVWSVDCDRRDFRKCKWTAGPEMKIGRREAAVIESQAEKAYRAFFVDAEYDNDGKPYHLTTPIRIVEKK
jgi:PhoPQ-activated pathogenicity-related protein